MIQLYGRFDGYWSHAVVSRGIVQGLLANGVCGLRLHNVGAPHELRPEEVYQDLPEGAVVGYNSRAPIGFYVGGYPPFAEQWLADHPIRGALFIAESETLPRTWSHVVNSCHRIFVPSSWVKTAYQGIGMPNGRISVVHHGVDLAFGRAWPDASAQPLRLLHVAGAASFLDRKGTPQLLEAFKRVFPRASDARLTLRTPDGEGFPIRDLLHETYAGADSIGIVLDARPACPPAEMAQLIAQHHAVVQPSRAEAFGIVPCEARALGVPVVMTACSGHAEHIDEHDLLVESGASAPIVVNGIPSGGRAPSVSVDAVVKALRSLPHKLPALRAAARARARGYVREWTWERRTRLLADWLKFQQQKAGSRGRGGRRKDLGEL